MSRVTVIVPCYNEAEVLPEFYRRLDASVRLISQGEVDFLFVNDGSTDTTGRILDCLAERDQRVKVLHLACNRGHQAALTAGMDFAAGDILITLDADLQDQPEHLPAMVEKLREGYDIVHMQRRSRAGESWFKLASARWFYRFLQRLTGNGIIENCGDFRAFTRRVLETMRAFREEHRFLRGMFASLGFRQAVLLYDRDQRYAGSTKYPLARMVRLAANAVLSFSAGPLRAIAWLSFLLWASSLLYLGKALFEYFVLHVTVQGWTSIIILMTFYTGIIIFCLAIIAAYIGRVFEQGQRRPVYWVMAVRNLDLREGVADVPEVRLSKAILDATDHKSGNDAAPE